MKPRLRNPVALIPEVMAPAQALGKVADEIPQKTPAPRAHACEPDQRLRVLPRAPPQHVKSDETQQRLLTVAAWRDSPFFSDAERAALALTEGSR